MTTVNEEREIAIYARILIMDGFNQADAKEEIVQAEIKNRDNGKVRVRKSVTDEGTHFTMTIKEKIIDKESEVNVESNQEITIPIDEQFFTSFYNVTSRRQHKVRYKFIRRNVKLIVHHSELESISLPEIVYDVDTFIKEDGSISEYCKIDCEVDSILEFLKQNYPEIKDIKLNLRTSGLPFEPVDAFIDKQANDKQKALLDHLYTNEFNR